MRTTDWNICTGHTCEKEETNIGKEKHSETKKEELKADGNQGNLGKGEE